jgi:hypothetical protein
VGMGLASPILHYKNMTIIIFGDKPFFRLGRDRKGSVKVKTKFI